jgi:hypothetical protein
MAGMQDTPTSWLVITVHTLQPYGVNGSPMGMGTQMHGASTHNAPAWGWDQWGTVSNGANRLHRVLAQTTGHSEARHRDMEGAQ